MAATEGPQRREDAQSPLQALMTAALALPILAVPARATAAEPNEIGFNLLAYKERDQMKVTEPVLWARAQIQDVWQVEASALVDIISGASPRLVTNQSGAPVQTLSGASIHDQRNAGDLKVTRRIDDLSLSASRTVSNEKDYDSKAFGLEADLDLNQRNTTLVAGFGKSNDRVGSSDNPDLHEPRYTKEYLVGVTQLLTPTDLVQSTMSWAKGEGYYNDPYKFTLTFYPSGPAVFASDTRPDHRDTFAWLVRYRGHYPQANGSLQVDYRFYRDDWGIHAHTLDVGWQQTLNDRWEVRPGLRYYTQNAADFYAATIPQPQPAILSSDQRLSTWGGLSPSVRVVAHLDNEIRIEGTLGYVQNSASLHWGGSGSPAFSTLRAAYAIVGISRPF